jgi:restriction system protein
VSIPTYDRFIEPLLRYLAREGIAPTRAAYEAAADALALSPEQRAEVLPSGRQPIYRNRIGWAHDRLKRAGLSTSPRRGYWQITESGRAFVAQHPGPLSNDDVAKLSDVPDGSRLRPSTDDDSAPTVEAPAPVTGGVVQSPDERLEGALTELNESVAHDLLEAIGQSSPEFFEGLVLDLLHAMGYGTSRADLQQVGGTGDGGIDGIVSLDRLGLEKVYVQAKRWQNNSVGRPDVQAFDRLPDQHDTEPCSVGRNGSRELD